MKTTVMTIFVLFCVLLYVVARGGCYDEERSTKTLDSAGYENISIEGFKWFSCGKGDWYSTRFKARNPKGKLVEGVVCCGFISKDCTIRF